MSADWAHTSAAERNRNLKAITVAEWIRWQHHDSAWADTLDDHSRSFILHTAGVRTSHPGELWLRVVGLLRKWETENQP